MDNIIKPRIPKGFQEYLPQDQIQFNRMIEIIRGVYESYGYVPIETPAIEYAEVLLAKSGGDTEKQVYRFERGDKEYCLHFDLTVPLARYVAEHQQELQFPFRRYQIQKVWRAESPQKGRYREFYQCDIDVIGSESIALDAEFPFVICDVFDALGIDDYRIQINNRMLLNGLLESLGLQENSKEFLRLLDKVDKQGKDVLINFMKEIDASDDAIKAVTELLEFDLVDNQATVQFLRGLVKSNSQADKGIHQLEVIANLFEQSDRPAQRLVINPRIARGLDYYTGTVYETTLTSAPEVGSVCSGGRFDDLASLYTTTRLPGIGVSIGLSRLFGILKEKGSLVQAVQEDNTIILLGSVEFLGIANKLAFQLRKSGIVTEIHPDADKLAKLLKYADRRGIANVLILGGDEVQSHKVSYRNMNSRRQVEISLDDIDGIVREIKER